MLISSSFQISPNVTQASLGDSHRWIVEGDRAVAFIDGSASNEISLFEQRLEKLDVHSNGRAAYRLFTADDVDRLYFPARITKEAKAIVSNKGRKHSPPGLIELSTESASLDLGAVTIKRIPLNLATPSSAAYLIEPDGVLVADQSIGFYRGRELPAPGAGSGLSQSVEKLRELCKLSITALGLPWGGTLAGALAVQHLSALTQVTADLLEEFKVNYQSHITESMGSPSAESVAAELRSTLYFLPPDFLKSPSVRYTAAIAKACDETCVALLKNSALPESLDD